MAELVVAGEPCKPKICEIEQCLIACINSGTEYTVGAECGKESVSVEIYLGPAQPDPTEKRKSGNCGKGRRKIQELVVVINANTCTSGSCAVFTAHEQIQHALCESKCCARVTWLKDDSRVSDRKAKTDEYVVIYLIRFNDPNAI